MREYLGQAIQNPPVITEFGRIGLINDKALIKQSVLDRLLTPLGAEFFNRQNGSIINQLLFEQNDAVLLDLLEYYIRGTIQDQCKRVDYLGTEFFQDENNISLIHCTISVKILQSSEVMSLVMPFYKEIES